MTDAKTSSAAPKDPNQQIKMLLMVVLVVAAVVPFVATNLAMNSLSVKLQGSPTLGAANNTKEAPAKQTVFYDPLEFLVNLADTESSHYLRATLCIGSEIAEVTDVAKKKSSGHGGGHGEGKAEDASGPKPEILNKIKVQEPIIRDIVISVISSYSMAALISAQGKRELKETIQERLKKQLGAENLEVYFTAFTLQ